ncbi:maleylpyruvate isomerase N-terminal domain-containing protein, partial [Vibrio parahaemolyticus]
MHNDIGRLNEAWVVGWRERSDAELLDELRDVTAERLAALRAMDDDDFSKPSWTPVGQATYGR